MNNRFTIHTFIHTNSPPPQPPLSIPSSPSKISPTLLLIIILLAVIFFMAGLIHLILRFFLKRPLISSPIFQSENSNSLSLHHSHSLQRQLRQLFRLHDTGLDQAAIDALPIFRYETVLLSASPPRQRAAFDCAVCLSAFAAREELRLLPACAHAFHARCIDAWLLASATCPLCRRAVLVADLFADAQMLGFDDQPSEREAETSAGRVFSIRLGKFERSSGGGEGESSRCNMDARRCYSMGTCRYVVGEADLRVTLRGEAKAAKDWGDSEGKKISRRQKGESFSVSKIWLWSKNGRFPSCSDTDIHLPTSLGASFGGHDQAQSSQMV